MILDSLREVHVIIDLKYIVVPHRLSNSFVMHKQEKTGHKKLNKKQSHKRGKSASKARRILTSKDVYYLVVKYEQENISKKAVENQEKLGNSSRGKIIMDNEEFELETIKETKSRRRSRSSSTKEIEKKKEEYEIAGNSDTFEDERECALQSAMTSHSDQIKEQGVDEDLEEVIDDPEDTAAAQDSPLPNEDDDIYQSTHKKESTNIRDEHDKTVENKSETFEEDDINDKDSSYNVNEDSTGNGQQTSQKNDQVSKDSREDLYYDDPGSVASDDEQKDEVIHDDRLSNSYESENDKEDARKRGFTKDKEEDDHLTENEETSYSDHDINSRQSTKYSSTDQHSKYDQPRSPLEYSLRSNHGRTKPLKKVVLAGLPPRKPLALLTTKKDPKENNIRHEMKRIVQEILLRGDKKIKDLSMEAQNLRRNTEILSEENKALKKIHKLQAREIQEVDQFVSMTTSRTKDVRKDVRDTEVTSFDIGSNVRKQVKEILLLRQECERYEKLIELDRKIPRRSILQERLQKAEEQLESRDKEIETLNKKVLAQQKRMAQERQKENKKFAQLDEEINGTMEECDEIKLRLKDAERRIDKSNIYSRRNTSSHKALPASASLPALTWHPPVRREKTKIKVKKWLNDSNNKHR